MSEELRLMRLAAQEIETIREQLKKLAHKLDQPGYRDFRNRVDKASWFASQTLRVAMRLKTGEADFGDHSIMQDAPTPHLAPPEPLLSGGAVFARQATIQKAAAVLKDKSAAGNDRYEALKYLVFFVGDIHQPLHCEDDTSHQGGTDNRYGGYASSGQSTNEQLFGACMNASGWSLVRPSAGDQPGNKAEVAAVQSAAKEKALALCAESKFAPYYAKTACLAPQITFEQLADASKISPAAKAILVELRSRLEALAQENMDSDRRLFGARGEKAASLFLTTIKPQSDQTNLDLYNGQITWGEYNKRRQAIYAEYQGGLKKL